MISEPQKSLGLCFGDFHEILSGLLKFRVHLLHSSILFINAFVFQLLERLTSKGKRQPEFTRELIKKKLTDDEDGIATTNLKVQIDMF